jgi:SAM-dependent methyltransferase
MTTTTAPTETPAREVSPEPIMQIAAGFMAAKHLFAASELGVFETLADSPATLDALAARTGLTRRAARISADAMVALGLLERDGEHYRNGPAAAHYLTGRHPGDLRPLLRFWDRISYPTWESLATALVSGPPQEVFDLDDDQQAIVSAGIEAATTAPAHALIDVVDFSTRRRLLDVGGGTGSWSIATLRRHPHLRGAVVELPAVAELARTRIAEAGLADRLAVVAADAFADDLPGDHDAILVANLVHYRSPADNTTLLRRIRAAAPAGARLLLADMWTDRMHTRPVRAALLAGEYAVHMRDGDVYSVAEVRNWLPAAGWRFVEHVPLVGGEFDRGGDGLTSVDASPSDAGPADQLVTGPK